MPEGFTILLLLKLIAWLWIMTTCNITLHYTRSYLIWRIRDILLKHLTQYVLHFILCPKVKFKMYNFPFILHLGGAQIKLKLIFNFKLFSLSAKNAGSDENQHSLKKSKLMTPSHYHLIPSRKTIYNQLSTKYIQSFVSSLGMRRRGRVGSIFLLM